jgi:1-acyl-sn-glycerol-3-phosphate acyltransferase
MRTITTWLALFVATTISGLTSIIAAALRIPERPGGIYEKCIQGWATALNRAAGVTLFVHGEENIRSGAVYMTNHVSWFDIFTVGSVLPRFTWIAKSELRRIPLFGAAAAAAGIIFIERDNRKAAFGSYRVASAEIEKGRNVVVCPEGTRGPEYALRPFKKAPFVLAITAQSPIVPVVIHGTREVMGLGWRVRSGDVHVHFLEPIETRGLTFEDRAALTERVWQRMAEVLRTQYGIDCPGRPLLPANERSA